MNQALSLRMAMLTGLVLAAAVALWWLGSTRLALNSGSDPSRSAAEALQALLLVRGIALGVLSVRESALHGWRAGVAASLTLVAPAWPVVVLVWSAGTAPLPQAVLAELVLLGGCLALPMIGSGLRRALPRPEQADLAATALAVVLVASLWFMRGLVPG